jgi:hypothetical protein
MTGADRKAVKSELRAALRAKARGLPLSPHAEAVMLWIAWLKRTGGDQAAKRVPGLGNWHEFDPHCISRTHRRADDPKTDRSKP